MNEGMENDEENKRKRENQSQDKFQKILQDSSVNEKIVEDNAIEANHSNAQPATESGLLFLTEEEKYEESENTSLETLLAAWWKFKRANKFKKKKKKILKIYRDENYWTRDNYTDDEDFNFPENVSSPLFFNINR